MKTGVISVFLIVCCISCSSNRGKNAENEGITLEGEMAFDKAKWKLKEGEDYPFRDRMLHDLVYNDTVRSLNKDEILNLLGEPDRINEEYLYYMIAQKRLASWPLHTKTMVIKFSEENTIDWIKIHD